MSHNAPAPKNQDSTLAEHAAEIRRLAKHVIGDVVEIGRRLAEAKDMLGHGRWLPWLKHEFGWTNRTAENFVNIYRLSGKFENFSNLDLPLSALYLLAAPSTPETVTAEVIARARGGEVIPLSAVKHVVDVARSRRQPAKRTEFRAWHREAKLGDETIAKLRNTSLASAREQDALVLLNRGAPEGELKPEVEQLVADACAGKDVSAIEVRNNGVPPPRNNIGSNGSSEVERLRVRNEELEAENCQLKFENFKLHREIEKLKARPPAPTDRGDGGDGLAIPDFLDRTRIRP